MEGDRGRRMEEWEEDGGEGEEDRGEKRGGGVGVKDN